MGKPEQNQKRFLRLAEPPRVKTGEVVVSVPHDMVGPLALELSLLLFNGASSLRLAAQKGPGVVLTVGPGTRVSTATAQREPNGLRFELGRNQAESLLAVLLRAHRDGAAQVNHIHIESELGGESFDLTVWFEQHMEPMSQEEAMRRLFNEDEG
jgi:hypothetical protein